MDRKTGKTTITKQEGKDILRCGRHTVKLSENGVFAAALTEEKNEKGNTVSTTLEGMSKSDARKTFNFMADNTNVEWGYMESLDKKGGFHYTVGTGHNFNRENVVFSKFQSMDSQSIIRYDHSHPLRGWNDVSAYQYSTNDVNSWELMLKQHTNATMGMRCAGKYMLFYKNGKPTDLLNVTNKATE